MNEYMRNMQLREKLDAFIESLLINQQAKKLKIEVCDKEIQETVEGIKKQNMITDSELKEQLKNDKIDYKEFIEGIRGPDQAKGTGEDHHAGSERGREKRQGIL